MPFELDNVEPQDLFLQDELRNELKTPLGELIKGTIEETTPLLLAKLSHSSELLIGVGDVTAELLVSLELHPDLIITDGLNKREQYTQLVFEGYKIIHTKSPSAMITASAWEALRTAKIKINEGEKVHIIVDGEEDLLVLPILTEFPDNSRIVYGQPNAGSVIRIISPESREYALGFMKRMRVVL